MTEHGEFHIATLPILPEDSRAQKLCLMGDKKKALSDPNQRISIGRNSQNDSAIKSFGFTVANYCLTLR
jgi:hypothetical protein